MDIIKGNIFTTKCSTIVNTVNCVGVMGAGIAYEFRLRYPVMYEKYKEHCRNNLIDIGKLWIYKSETDKKWILNFPTKYHWRYPTKEEYLVKGLEKFVNTYNVKGIKSIAFPLLGASNGGLKEEQSLEIMKKYLDPIKDIKIEVYYFDPKAKDDLYIKFKHTFNNIGEKELSRLSGIKINYIKKIKIALEDDENNSLSSLLRVKGIGDVTLEKSFNFVMKYKDKNFNEYKLF